MKTNRYTDINWNILIKDWPMSTQEDGGQCWQKEHREDQRQAVRVHIKISIFSTRLRDVCPEQCTPKYYREWDRLKPRCGGREGNDCMSKDTAGSQWGTGEPQNNLHRPTGINTYFPSMAIRALSKRTGIRKPDLPRVSERRERRSWSQGTTVQQ